MPGTFVIRVRTIPKTEKEELPEGYSNTPHAHILNGAPSPTTIPISPYALTKHTSLPHALRAGPDGGQHGRPPTAHAPKGPKIYELYTIYVCKKSTYVYIC